MRNQSSAVLFAIPMLLLGGFVIMLGMGFSGGLAFGVGGCLYALGAFVGLRYSDPAVLRRQSQMALVFFLVNLTFYASAEVLPLLDISLIIYGILIVHLAAVAFVLHQREKIDGELPHLKAAVALLVAIAVSVVFASHRKEVIYFFGFNLGALALAYSVSVIFRNQLRMAISTVKITAVLAGCSSIVAIWQLYSSSFKTYYYPYVAIRDQKIMELWEVVSRVVGTWQHPSYLGIFLAITIPLSAYLFFYDATTWWERLTWATCILLSASVVLLTNTRSSVLAGAFGIAMLYVFANLPGWAVIRKMPNTHKVVSLGLLAASALVLYQFVFVPQIYSKPQAYRADASATVWGRFLGSDTMSNESLVQRSQLWELAWQQWREYFVVGMGAKNFQYAVEHRYGTGTDGHNLLLQTAAEMGTIGVVSIIWLYGSLVISMLRRAFKFGGATRYLAAALASVVVLILFDSMFNNPLYSLRITSVFWLAVGLLYSLPRPGAINV